MCLRQNIKIFAIKSFTAWAQTKITLKITFLQNLTGIFFFSYRNFSSQNIPPCRQSSIYSCRPMNQFTTSSSLAICQEKSCSDTCWNQIQNRSCTDYPSSTLSCLQNLFLVITPTFPLAGETRIWPAYLEFWGFTTTYIIGKGSFGDSTLSWVTYIEYIEYKASLQILPQLEVFLLEDCFWGKADESLSFQDLIPQCSFLSVN